MKKEELIGKKVRGFRFVTERFNAVGYMSTKMDKYVGKEGVIEEYNIQFDSYRVKFEDGMSYHYPVERIEHHLVDEENEKTKVVCTNTICQGECGECNYMEVVSSVEPAIEIKEGDYIRGFEITHKGFEFTNKYIGLIGKVTNIGRHSIRVKFTDNEGVWYPKDQAITHLCNDDMKEFEKSLDQNEEPDEETKAKVERAMKALEKGIANSKLNESCIDYGKTEHDPLDDLPIIGEGVLMEVSNQGITWVGKNVFAKYNNSFVAWADHESTISIQLWEQARPITPKTKITRKEFESKFEIID